jgi:type I restriction enzyme M protein
LAQYPDDVPDEALPEAIADLLAEAFGAAELDEADSGEEAETAALTDEDRLIQAEERLNQLRAALLAAKQRLIDLDSDREALEQDYQLDVDITTKHWGGTPDDLKAALKHLKDQHKAKLQTLKERQKDRQKPLKAEIKALEKQIAPAERELKQATTRGKLELILADADLIGTLKEHWIAAEVAKRLDYGIFLATSERGGKDNSGDYRYVADEHGSLVEFPPGHPQEGQLVVDQDLVNYDLGIEDLADAASIPDEQVCITEAFVRHAQAVGFDFWMKE